MLKISILGEFNTVRLRYERFFKKKNKRQEYNFESGELMVVVLVKEGKARCMNHYKSTTTD